MVGAVRRARRSSRWQAARDHDARRATGDAGIQSSPKEYGRVREHPCEENRESSRLSQRRSQSGHGVHRSRSASVGSSRRETDSRSCVQGPRACSRIAEALRSRRLASARCSLCELRHVGGSLGGVRSGADDVAEQREPRDGGPLRSASARPPNEGRERVWSSSRPAARLARRSRAGVRALGANAEVALLTQAWTQVDDIAELCRVPQRPRTGVGRVPRDAWARHLAHGRDNELSLELASRPEAARTRIAEMFTATSLVDDDVTRTCPRASELGDGRVRAASSAKSSARSVDSKVLTVGIDNLLDRARRSGPSRSVTASPRSTSW